MAAKVKKAMMGIKDALRCRCGGVPTLCMRVRMWLREYILERLECNKCGVASPEVETTKDRDAKISKIVEAWNKVMR